MSLAALAVRLATVRALKGRTFAGAHVFDSKIDPLNLVVSSGHEFVVIVTTDDDDMTVEGRDLLAGDHRLELVIEVVAMAKLAVQSGEGEGAETLTIPATDAGLEATLNLIGWQIARALAAGGGAWGDLWRSIVLKVREITSRRGADETNGVRYAARQYIFRVDHIAEPEPGVAPADVWARIVAALKADDELSAIGKIIEATVAADAPEPWERVRAALGLADDASGWIAGRPFEDGAALDAVDLEDGFVVDEEAAEAADGPEESD